MSLPPKPSRYDRFVEREKAQNSFWKEQQKADQARQANTARLKALRLAKEAADKAAVEAAPVKPAPKRVRKAK